jgi:hypothetical protein
MDGKGTGITRFIRLFMYHYQGLLLSSTALLLSGCKILDHNIVSFQGLTICTACGRTSDFGGSCTGTHDIAGMTGKVLCKKCGRTTGEFDSACVENHDINPVMGKLMCRKCGTTGLLSAFQKKRCNSNHSISVIDGVPKCRRCGATKDWTTKRCGV